jgi:hypothetical protein
MYEKILKHLQSYKNTNITISQLEALAEPDMTYSAFQPVIQSLLDNQVLMPVSKHGTNGKNPPLPLTFRIQKHVITLPLKLEIQAAQLRFHHTIKLDSYFKSSQVRWNKDRPAIEKVHEYLTRYGMPQVEATAPERSFQLVGDEKWIDEKGGRKLLENVGLWNLMKISTMPDPLMLSVNLRKLRESQAVYRHLIVENKSTYYAIQPILSSLSFATLIYGAGWKVISGIENLQGQLSVGSEIHHHFVYFGDLDHEGIAIWHSLYQKCKVVPAVGLYQRLLEQNPSFGKGTQLVRNDAVNRFAAFFSNVEGLHIQALLNGGRYLPQEALETGTLRNILQQGHE